MKNLMTMTTRTNDRRMAQERSNNGGRVQYDISAGGVVVRCTPDARLEVIICRRATTGLWALPKGTPEPEETREQTALREVQEETGLEVAILKELGSVRYYFTADGVVHDKTVFHYLMEPSGGSLDDHDGEFDSVEWLPLEPATLGRMTYDTDVEVLNRAIRAMAPNPDAADGY